METLFLDTTNGISVGLLNEDLEWEHFHYIDSNKSSSIVHKLIKDALDETSCSMGDIKKLIQISGPGSYTGMRVSDGISQIMDWEGLETYGLHHFQVPRILGYEKGAWLAKAFKGEIFCYEWDQNVFEQRMIRESDLPESLEKLKNEKKKIFSTRSFDLIPAEVALIETSKLIKENAGEIFQEVLSRKMKEALYYFRSIDDEFSKSGK
jgi:tRNA threonylcarbamoyladenosine biosynthesis protein TsaB